MALITLGTAAIDSLTAVVWNAAIAQADVRAINSLIVAGTSIGARAGSGFVREGMLYVKRRGVLQLLPDDVVATDSSGGTVIVLSAAAAASAFWVRS